MWFRTIMTRRIIIYTNERRNPEWVCPFETLTQLYTSQSPTHAHSVTISQCTPHPFFTIVRWPKKNYNNFLVWQTQVIIIIFEKLFRSDRPPRYPIFQFDCEHLNHTTKFMWIDVCAMLRRKKNLSAIKRWWRYVVTKCIQFFPFGRNVYKVSAIMLSICVCVFYQKLFKWTKFLYLYFCYLGRYLCLSHISSRWTHTYIYACTYTVHAHTWQFSCSDIIIWLTAAAAVARPMQ